MRDQRETHGSGLSPLYGLMVALTLTAALGWPYVLVFVLIAGPWLGAHHVSSSRKGTGSSAC